MDSNIKKLPINLNGFGFVQREKRNGKAIKYRCGRDFLYYTLHYYYPKKYNPSKLSPANIEASEIFGPQMPWWLMWTGFAFRNVPDVFRVEKLNLTINSLTIESFSQLLQVFLLPKKVKYSKAINIIEKSVDRNIVSGIDLSLGCWGLVDHIMFVYGYDENNFYVFDTHKVKGLNYKKMTNDKRFIMQLPKNEVKQRWKRFSRIWIVQPKPK